MILCSLSLEGGREREREPQKKRDMVGEISFAKNKEYRKAKYFIWML